MQLRADYIVKTGMDKTCKKCAMAKPLTDFHANAKCTGDGHVGTCKVCVVAGVKAWQLANPDKARAYVRKWNGSNRLVGIVATKKWKAANPDLVRRSALAWQRANPAQANARNSRHRASKRQATPAWADHDAIRAVYREAQQRTLITGVEHHVDHIVPLRSKIVVGFHVHQNLQILPAKVNSAKGNRHWPDMPTGV